MIIRCPRCKVESEIPHVNTGRHIECVCGKSFSIEPATVVKEYSEVDEPPPDKIGIYPVEKFLGNGGMGKVFKGIHPELGLPVAIKTLLRGCAKDPEFKDRFIQSAQICARIDHPNVVKVYDFGEEKDGSLYLVLEYLSGGTLFDILEKTPQLPQKQIAEIALSVCAGLSVAEKHGIVHRDIKPDNIMISATGEYKISDLGLASQSGRLRQHASISLDSATEKTLPLNKDPESLGTPEYMPPEQSIDASKCDIRADIYALGVTMYQMAAGRLPFTEHDPDKLRRCHRDAEAMVPGYYRKDLDPQLDYIIMTCMRKKPNDRYQMPEEVAADLKAYLAGEPLPSMCSGPDPRQARPPIPPTVRFGLKRELSLSEWVRVAVICIMLSSIVVLALLMLFDTGVPKQSSKHVFEHSIFQEGESRKIINRSKQVASPVYVNDAFEDSAKVRSDTIWQEVLDEVRDAEKNISLISVVQQDLQAFVNDRSNRERSREALKLIGHLNGVRIRKTNEFANSLRKKAESLMAKHEYDAAIAVYAKDPEFFAEETRSFRSSEVEKIRAVKSVYEKQQQEKKRIALAEENFKNMYASFDISALTGLINDPVYGPKINPDLKKWLKIYSSVPIEYAKRQSPGRVIKFLVLKTNRIPADAIPSEITISYVDKEKIFFRSSGGKEYYYTFDDLVSEDQRDLLKEIFSSEAAQAYSFLKEIEASDFARAKFQIKQGRVPQSLYHNVPDLDKVGLIRSFEKALSAELKKAGLNSNPLPDSATLRSIEYYSKLNSFVRAAFINSMKKFESAWSGRLSEKDTPRAGYPKIILKALEK